MHVVVGIQSSYLERRIEQIIHLSILPIHYRKSQHEPGRGWRVIDHDKNAGPITNKQLCPCTYVVAVLALEVNDFFRCFVIKN